MYSLVLFHSSVVFRSVHVTDNSGISDIKEVIYRFFFIFLTSITSWFSSLLGNPVAARLVSDNRLGWIDNAIRRPRDRICDLVVVELVIRRHTSYVVAVNSEPVQLDQRSLLDVIQSAATGWSTTCLHSFRFEFTRLWRDIVLPLGEHPLPLLGWTWWPGTIRIEVCGQILPFSLN